MNILWYFLTAILGVFGALALIRSIEMLLVGAGLMPIQIVIAAVFLFLGWQCLRKARFKTSTQI